MHEAGHQDPQSDLRTVRTARALLGVTADADAPELTRAYWRQARRLHPDLSTDPDATEQFRSLHAAYRLALQAAADARPSAPSPPGQHQSWGADDGVWVVAGPVCMHATTSSSGRPRALREDRP